MREIAFESVTAKEKLRPPRSQAYVLHDPTSLVSRSRPFRQFFFSFFTVCFFLLLPFPLFWQPMTASWTSRVRHSSRVMSLSFFSTLHFLPFLSFSFSVSRRHFWIITREKHSRSHWDVSMAHLMAQLQCCFARRMYKYYFLPRPLLDSQKKERERKKDNASVVNHAPVWYNSRNLSL